MLVIWVTGCHCSSCCCCCTRDLGCSWNLGLFVFCPLSVYYFIGYVYFSGPWFVCGRFLWYFLDINLITICQNYNFFFQIFSIELLNFKRRNLVLHHIVFSSFHNGHKEPWSSQENYGFLAQHFSLFAFWFLRQLLFPWEREWYITWINIISIYYLIM